MTDDKVERLKARIDDMIENRADNLEWLEFHGNMSALWVRGWITDTEMDAVYRYHNALRITN